MSQTVGAHILERLHGHGVTPHLRLSRRRHQRHPRRLPRARRRDRVRPGRPRGARGVHGVRAREVQRRRRRLPRDLRAGRDPPPQRALRRQARPSAGRRDRRPAGSRISLGASYQQEVDLGSLFKDVASEYVQVAMAPAQVTHLIDRAVQIARATRSVDLRDRPRRPAGGGGRGAAARARRRLLRRADAASRACSRTTPTSSRAAEVLNAGERVAILIGQGAREAAAEVEELAERLGAGVAKALNGRDVLPDDLPFVTGSIGLLGTQAERRDDAGLRHAADDRLGLPVLRVAARAGPGARRADRPRRAHARHPLPDGGQPRRRRARHAAGAAAAARAQDGPLLAGARSIGEIERWWTLLGEQAEVAGRSR